MIRRPGTILVLLTGLNLLNYIDRLVLSAVLPKIQADLDLSNFEGGLLATIFLVSYMVTAPAFGSLGDRTTRKGLIALGVLVWSLATIASGFATNALTLFVARAFVGIGEASYATLAPTIIDDVTPPERKGRALGIFYLATPIGAALGYLIGGFVEKHWGWQAAFYVAGVPGIALALACLAIQEPARKMRTEKADILRDIGTLVRLPDYRRAVLGYCAYTAAVGAFSYWAPKFLFTRYGLDLASANFRFGIITVVAGGLSTLLGGTWADRTRRRIEGTGTSSASATAEGAARAEGGANDAKIVRGLLKICAVGSFVGAPLSVLAFLSPQPGAFFVAVFFCILALFVSTSPINAVILGSVPPDLRASAMALSIFAIHVLGDLWSPPLVGFLADRLPIQLAMMTLPAAIAVSAWIWRPRRTSAA